MFLRGLDVRDPCEDEAMVVNVTPFAFVSVGIAGGFRRRGGGAGAALR